VNFFDVCSTPIQRYDTILIDEVQDYKNEWIQILNQKFLKENGEFVVFGDPSQNIYHRDVDTQGDIRIGTIPGLWNKSLSRSERFSNPSLAELAVKFKVQFKIGSITEQEHDIRLNSQLSFNLIKYFSRVPQESLKDTAQSILDITYQVLDTLQQRNSPEIRNVAIICANTDILKEIDYLYRGVNNTSTTLTFLNKEQEAKISRNSHVASWEYKRDYDRKERQIKDAFTTDTPFLKLATIQSFKGWEAKTVILIIMSERNVMHKSDTMSEQDNKDTQFNVPELIYTGITRSRENLIVINVGNDTYHEFFKSNIQ
jgi:superfamily I DNA/RNA helicase